MGIPVEKASENKRVSRKGRWALDSFFKLTSVVMVVFGLSMIPLISGGKFYITKNMEVYYKDINECLWVNSGMFKLDTKTDTRILGRELAAVCKKETNALRGFFYEGAGFLFGWYLFNEAEAGINANAEAVLFRVRNVVLIKNP